ncbi:hypothetical protein V3N99_03605 [Dermatophilaceae bacterium Soc4.6]
MAVLGELVRRLTTTPRTTTGRTATAEVTAVVAAAVVVGAAVRWHVGSPAADVSFVPASARRA